MAAIEAVDVLMKDNALIQQLHVNTDYFRSQIQALGFEIIEGAHPIVPIMLGEASVAMDMSAALLEEGVTSKDCGTRSCLSVKRASGPRFRRPLDGRTWTAPWSVEKVGRRMGVI